MKNIIIFTVLLLVGAANAQDIQIGESKEEVKTLFKLNKTEIVKDKGDTIVVSRLVKWGLSFDGMICMKNNRVTSVTLNNMLTNDKAVKAFKDAKTELEMRYGPAQDGKPRLGTPSWFWVLGKTTVMIDFSDIGLSYNKILD